MVEQVIPVLVVAMLATMFWMTAVRLRRDRVKAERRLSRGRHAFTRRERIRFLLGQAFQPKADRPDWQEELQARLDQAAREPQKGESERD